MGKFAQWLQIREDMTPPGAAVPPQQQDPSAIQAQSKMKQLLQQKAQQNPSGDLKAMANKAAVDAATQTQNPGAAITSLAGPAKPPVPGQMQR